MQQIEMWRAWAAGQLTDSEAQAAAEALAAEKRAQRAAYAGKLASQGTTARPQKTRTATAASRRGLRPKVFGDGRPIPLDRNAKVRLWVYARALSRRTEPGLAYGQLTAKALAVLQALLWGFHNAANGRCFPSYEAIAKRAGCARSTVAEAIRMLERAGVLTWVNRIKRVREACAGLFGKASAWRWRVVRTSNAYAFNDPASKSENPTQTTAQVESKQNFANNVPRRAASAVAYSRSGRAGFDMRRQKKASGTVAG